MKRPISIVKAARGENNTEYQQISSTASPTPLRQRQRRPPLRSRDANDVMAMRGPQKGTPLSSKSGNATMPDKPSLGGASRHIMPTLGAPAGKPNKAPLTPRVAVNKAPVTPRLRQDVSSNSAPNVAQKEEISTPVSTFLTNNITPRSSSRKTRVDSASSTPTNTPTGSSVPDSSRYHTNTPIQAAGLGIIGSDVPPRRLAVAFSPSQSEGELQRDHPHAVEDKFFYANDVKSTTPAPSRRPPLTSKSSSSSFLYANGDIIQTYASPSSNVGSTLGEDKSKPKFFHANGTPDITASPSYSSHPANSTVSAISQLPPLSTLPPSQVGNPTSPKPWPSSPGRIVESTHPTHSRSVSVLSPASLSRPQPPVSRQQESSSPRRDSLEKSARPPSHEKSSSLGKLEPSAHAPLSTSPVSAISSSEQGTGKTVTPLGDIVDQIQETLDVPPDAQSPIKPSSSLERMNELAANARRERKVLDLEITNSSLAAINRTLEREMRKQTAELRRFRRLSRSGRLSINTRSSTRTSLASLGTDGTDPMRLSDLSEDEESTDDDSDISEEDSVDDGSLSPRALAESDARHRKRDEMRLQLDLSKHQQLLIDSQKMNQSLKRCLGWTEELISEGRKALDYQVRVSDVELGGRVLAPDDLDENDPNDISVLSQGPKITTSDSPGGWNSEEKGDRDSGIEVTADRNLDNEQINGHKEQGILQGV